jgi:hypothetical protein
MKRKILIGLMYLATGFTACKKIDRIGCPGGGGDGDGATDCTAVMCTMVFEEDHIVVKNASGAPVQLSSFVVTDLNGTPLPQNNGMDVFGYPHNGNNGMYTVINDGWVNGHQNTSKNVRVKGYVNFMEVFNEPATISADCCHVKMTSGKSTITVSSN